MKPITCVITDDEPLAAEGLRRYVEKVDFLRLIGVCEDAMKLNMLLQTEHPDLIFLDIEMPYLTGLDLLASIPNPPRVIITSAYEKYALRGYELNVDDYLLKPISFVRFMKSVNRIRDLIQTQTPSVEDANPSFFVRSDKQMHRVFVNDIILVEGLENYVCIYLPSGKLTVRSTLRHIVESLPPEKFLQIHRSYVVNIEKIDKIDGNQLCVAEHKLTIARGYRNDVFDRLLKNAL